MRRGLELAYQRVPGVIDTSVGYTQGKDDKVRPCMRDVFSSSRNFWTDSN